MDNNKINTGDFAPFIETMRASGVSKTVSYELLDDGLVETFLIGRRRYVLLDSLRSLPARIADRETKAAA